MTGGQTTSMEMGGVTAALQSIGATGFIKPKAAENLQSFREKIQAHARQRRASIGQRRASMGASSTQLTMRQAQTSSPPSFLAAPPYFTASQAPHSVDYAVEGYNASKAEQMLNAGVHPTCRGPAGCPTVAPSTRFRVRPNMQPN